MGLARIAGRRGFAFPMFTTMLKSLHPKSFDNGALAMPVATNQA
jgi:hypothetical protein